MRPPNRLRKALLALLATCIVTCGTQGGHAITGTVTGASAVAVSLTGAATSTTTTDGAGGYAFTSLADGAYTVTPVKAGYTFTPASLAVTVAGADLVGQDFAATPVPHAITGTVSGASAVTVNLTGVATRTTITDGAGGYAFTGLADGAYTVTPEKAGYTFTPTSLAVTVAGADAVGQGFVAAAVTPSTIMGTVSGQAAQGVTMTLEGQSSATAVTDAQGRYAFPWLADGIYTVTPSMSGYRFDPVARTVVVGGQSVAGQDFQALWLHAIRGSVTGAVGGVHVPLALDGTSTGTTQTDVSGYFTFAGLIDGSYTVTPSFEPYGYVFTPASISVLLSGADAGGLHFVASPASCRAGATPACDDGNSCTADSCEAEACVFTPVPDWVSVTGPCSPRPFPGSTGFYCVGCRRGTRVSNCFQTSDCTNGGL